MVRLTSPLRPLPPAVRLRSLLLAALPISLLHAVLPVAPATSNHGFPPKFVPGGKALAGNLVNHSVIPIFIYISEDKVMMI